MNSFEGHLHDQELASVPFQPLRGRSRASISAPSSPSSRLDATAKLRPQGSTPRQASGMGKGGRGKRGNKAAEPTLTEDELLDQAISENKAVRDKEQAGMHL